MNFNDRFNDERYIDLTAYCAMRNIERSNRRTPQSEDWDFHRGDIYTAWLDPVFGSEQGGTRPVVVLQNNTGLLLLSDAYRRAADLQTAEKAQSAYTLPHRGLRKVRQ